MDVLTYLEARTDRSAGPDACWPWKLSVGSHGYGNAWDGRTVVLAHRLTWVAHRGPIPLGMTVDHLCRQRICVNPAHLRLLTNLENARDNGAKRRTHCPAGHPYDEANTYVRREGWRQCRTCHRNEVRGRR